MPGEASNPAEFSLDDWSPGARAASGPRKIRMHRMYLQLARRTGVPHDPIFTADDIAARDSWSCSVCGAAVLQRWTTDELGQAPALTFAAAWADGGRYDRKNARLAHFGCASFPDEGLRRRVGQLLVRDLVVKAHAAAGDQACSKGHELAGANLLKARDGRRRCRQCRRDRERAARP